MARLHVIVFTVGPTNAGKSTLMDVAKATPRVGTVEVGRLMRAKYPPSHFKGEGAPKHTQVEAWQMMVDGIAASVAAGNAVTFVDGQPRDVQQANDIVAQYVNNPLYEVFFLHLTCPEDIREQRRVARDGGDPEKDALSKARMVTDYRSLYNVFTRLQDNGVSVNVEDTSSPEYKPETEVSDWLYIADVVNGEAKPDADGEPGRGYVAQG